MTQTAQDRLCKALELAENGEDFYAGIASSCGDQAGRDVYAMLAERKNAQAGLVRAISDGLAQGQSWDAVCVYDEFGGEVMEKYRDLLATREREEACGSEMGALETAMQLEEKAAEFYAQWQPEAVDEAEKEFVRRMSEEQRAQHLALADLHGFYEDPEGWMRNQDGGLDGA